ncbi:hypothetical protein [Marinifilum caeruleilacunae]|uniref:Uncharacterized protein n=1 Tax=Marinifilum caeruleilacunae TaxID=2499076 RepID=A0ABX1X2B7_9BACT|nr:hypothetical protein [Marinifilum caeruleilacunae]NOU62228.1 hypothetical protein [Marinifilum caeruleilacunae]
MVDYINILLSDFDFKTWQSDKRLQFQFKISDQLDSFGNVVQTSSEVAHYRGLDFIRTLSGKCFVKGSIHRFFNAGSNNGNRFSYLDFMEALEELQDFGVIPDKAILKSFEFGLNLPVKEKHLSAKSFYNSIIYRIGEVEKCMSDDGNNLIGKQFITEDTTVKSYDKKQQAALQCSHEIIRYELRFRRMRLLKRFGIVTLYDLTDKDKLIQLFEKRLLKSVNETILLDWKALPNTNKLPEYQKKKFLNWRNPNWWREKSMTTKARNRNKISFENLIKNKARYDIKEILKNKLIGEFSSVIASQNFSPNGSTQKNMGTNAGRIVSGKHVGETNMLKRKYCLVCGKDITHLKKDAKYCNDNRKCRDKAYNLKVSKQRKARRTQKQKEILKIINELGTDLMLTRTTNPGRRKIAGIPGRKTSIIVTTNGKQKLYHGAAARFFLKEFEKKKKLNQSNMQDETNST